MGFAAVYLGNPGVFFFYLLLVGTLFEKANTWLIAKEVGANTTWMNPVTYILITFPMYVAWITLQYVHFGFELAEFLEDYVSVGSIIVAIPGLLNLAVWFTSGMEGNVMGFIFALPLLIATAVNLCMWLAALRRVRTSE